MKFYTSCLQYKDDILVRGYDNGKRYQDKIPYQPTLYIKSKGVNDSPFKSIYGEKLVPKKMNSIIHANKYVRSSQYTTDYNGKPKETFKVWGMTSYAYTYINEEFPDEIEYDIDLISILNFDIENEIDDKGFTKPEEARLPINAITMRCKGKVISLGTQPFDKEEGDNFDYTYCKDEKELLKRFLFHWRNFDPDIITGYNISFYDIPYLYNRITKLFGEKYTKLLSPWGIVDKKEVWVFGKPVTGYNIVGCGVLDYIQVDKKFSFKNRESYKLDNVAHEVLGKRKISYEEYGNLLNLYKNNWPKFIRYNVEDTSLVEEIDEKQGFIPQIIALTYSSKINFQDTLGSVKNWDVLIHNYLMKRNIIVEPMRENIRNSIVGGYVKDPQIGLHSWVVTFDLDALYPHLVMQYNISPDTLMDTITELKDDPVDKILDGFIDDKNKKILKDNNFTCAAGVIYDMNNKGFLPDIMENLYIERVFFKKKMLAAKQKISDIKSRKDSKKELKEAEKEVSINDNMQKARKTVLNSGYGVFSNSFFRWYDTTLAESITLSGQLAIKFIEKKVNIWLNKALGTTDKDYVIASDTDSIMVNMADIVYKIKKDGTTQEKVKILDNFIVKKMEPYIDKCYKDFALELNANHKMHMKREAIADKGIFVAKKRYVLSVWNNEGVSYDEPYQKIMGMEAIKSSTPEKVRGMIKDSIKIILYGDNDKLLKFIDDKYYDFLKINIEDLAKPSSCNNLEKYTDPDKIWGKGCPNHVKGALVYNKLIKDQGKIGTHNLIMEGEKIKSIPLKLPNPMGSNVISFTTQLSDDLNVKKYIDFPKIYDKMFLIPVNSMITAIDWKKDKSWNFLEI